MCFTNLGVESHIQSRKTAANLDETLTGLQTQILHQEGQARLGNIRIRIVIHTLFRKDTTTGQWRNTRGLIAGSFGLKQRSITKRR